ncbi:uncharacterized protein LOC123309247 [Coccinella septempunctata]|uniref:uncharacterized protein LOC123309247 n=1 Tax=Coccinella septempunctata TaxID=41139 RepID=UPI001D06B88C|nr:uncharacterized protein LOC123309247 [Coccinella septempunctata]
MRLCIIIAVFSFMVYQVEPACVDELMKLMTHDVTNTEMEMNVTIVDIENKIQKTKEDVESIIKETKLGIQSERDKLEDLENSAYGRSLSKKKSIADCLEADRVQMKIINTTESVIYSVCRADFSLFMVKLSLLFVESTSRKLEKDLVVCVDKYTDDCEKEKACIIETLKNVNDEINSINNEVEKKLNKIRDTSRICADGKSGVVISMIKEQEDKFNYCVEQILNDL